MKSPLFLTYIMITEIISFRENILGIYYQL